MQILWKLNEKITHLRLVVLYEHITVRSITLYIKAGI